eukprot:m51a1_g6041 hypothetical protein (662) ;mRNA; f:165777-169195
MGEECRESQTCGTSDQTSSHAEHPDSVDLVWRLQRLVGPATATGDPEGEQQQNPNSSATEEPQSLGTSDRQATCAEGFATRAEPSQEAWASIVGLDEAKRELLGATVLPHQFPALFSGGRRPWRGLLLYGAGGTGKTFLAGALASLAGVTAPGITFFLFSASELLGMQQPVDVAQVLLDVACERRPSVLVVDRVEELLRPIDGGAPVIGITAAPWQLDADALPFFERRVHVPLPDRDERRRLLGTALRAEELAALSPSLLYAAVHHTEGYTATDVLEVECFAPYVAMATVLNLCVALIPVVVAFVYWGRLLGRLHECIVPVFLVVITAWTVGGYMVFHSRSLVWTSVSYVIVAGCLVWCTVSAARKFPLRVVLLFYALPIVSILIFLLVNDMTLARWYNNTDNKWIRLVLRTITSLFFWLLMFISRSTSRHVPTANGVVPLPLIYLVCQMIASFWSIFMTYGLQAWELVAPFGAVFAAINLLSHELWWQRWRLADFFLRRCCHGGINPRMFNLLSAAFSGGPTTTWDTAYGRYYSQCLVIEALGRIGSVLGAAGLFAALVYAQEAANLQNGTVQGGWVVWVITVTIYVLFLELVSLAYIVVRSTVIGIPFLESCVLLVSAGGWRAGLTRCLAICLAWFSFYLFLAFRVNGWLPIITDSSSS